MGPSFIEIDNTINSENKLMNIVKTNRYIAIVQIVLAVIGFIVIFVCRTFQVIYHPEMTEAQLLIEFRWLYLFSVSLLAVSYSMFFAYR